ncbi:MAG: hypothetical protein QOJ06_1033, partial [Pseudonocardiales bacterium]|nr:hypothetical protein [Pseudonocardiales bacterium]
MVTAICAWRKICMTSRGCTSRSTSSVAQVRRPSCTVIFRTPALAQRASQERLKLRGSIGVPHLVGEDQLAALPRRPRELPRVGFLDLPEPQRGGADVRQRQRGIGGGCLGLPVQ